MDNGIQVAEQSRTRDSVTFRKMRFDLLCEANGIEHRLTKPNHPSGRLRWKLLSAMHGPKARSKG